ncbi:hypothetical protein [Sulfurimonas sp.]|uniref:hypothetical protein n=1 Tax=Sulfurimonas sp. TaxID=2022749 RepID=UPI002B47DAFE|nr:hypothetical protein [Sulfurimonas sp.]
MRFNTKLLTLFLDPISTQYYSISDGERVNIVLSPSLYWVKKISLPVKYARDAKKLLPSLFEDTLPEGNYSYSVYKKEDEFFIFAYEDKIILDAMSKVGISLSNVSSVHFAQSEMQGIEGAVKINESQSIYVKDDMLILVPCCWIEESGNLDMSELTLSKHKVVLQQYAHIVENSSLYKIGAVLVVLLLLVFGEYLITLQKTSEVRELKDELFTKNKLKPTMLQNKSMLKKYKTIHEKQTKLREYTSYLLSLRLQGSEKLSKLTLKDKTLDAEFSGASEVTLSRIQNTLKSKKVKFTTEIKNNTLHLEMLL